MPERPLTPPGYVLLTDAEYRRLLIAAETDDSLKICEVCGAWMDVEDPAYTGIIADFQGCWAQGSKLRRDQHLCRRERAPDRTPVVDDIGKDWIDYPTFPKQAAS